MNEITFIFDDKSNSRAVTYKTTLDSDHADALITAFRYAMLSFGFHPELLKALEAE